MEIEETEFRAVFAAIRRQVPEVEQKEKELGSRLTIAGNVLSLRVGRGWTQRELARRAGMTQPRITQIEAAQVNFGIDALDRLAAALEVPVAELFAREPVAGTRTARGTRSAPVRNSSAASPGVRMAADRGR